jgi:hypothetical protein
MAEEEDDKMAQRWQKKADGVLIFVSLQLTSSNSNTKSKL